MAIIIHSKTFTCALSRLAFTSSAYALALGSLASTASAQTAPPAPIRSSIDANGVDLFNDVLVVDSPGVTVGNQGSSFTYHAWNHGSGWSDNVMAFLTTSGSTTTIAVGETSDSFAVSGTTYTSATGNGATLTYNSTTKAYTYTSRDGTVVVFDGTRIDSWMPWGTSAIVQSVQRPSGERLTYNWTQQQYCAHWKAGGSGNICTLTTYLYRVNNIISSFGYQLTPSYDPTASSYVYDSTQPDVQPNFQVWSAFTGVSLYNIAKSTSTPALVETIADSVVGTTSYHTITDPIGHQYKYRELYNTPSAVAGITTPANSTETVSAIYNSSGLLTSVTNASGTTTYATVDAGNVRTVTVTDAQSHISTYVFDIPSQTMTSYTDPLTNKTSYAYDSYARVNKVTKPEGDYYQTAYDGRGNITQQTSVAKSGSGLANIVTTAGYDASCTITVKCNKPNWVKDALGNETDFTYDSTYGVTTSVTGPAAPNGIRPQARYTYSLLQAYYLNSSGSVVASGISTEMLTAVSSCLTQAGATVNGTAGVGPFTISGTAACAGTADESKTTISYGPQTAGTANNLLPISQTVAAGNGSVSATSSQTYDNTGNVVSKVGPLGSGQTTVMYYDADRRPLGTVSPDPDATGPRTPTAVKYTRNADGAVTLAQVGTVPDQTANSFNNSFTEAYHTSTVLDIYDRPIRTSVVSGSTNYADSDRLYDSLGRSWCSIQYMNMAAVPTAVATTSCTPSQTTGPYGPDRIAQSTFDADSRVLTQGDSIGTIVTNTYSANGNLASVKDGNNNLTAYTYDGYNRLSQVNFPMPSKGANASNPADYEAYSGYDANGNVHTRRLRDGNTLAFTYDNLGRLASRTPGGTAAISSNDYPVSYTYNLANAVTQIARASDGQTLGYSYDALGRVTNESQPFGSLAYQYDAAGDRTRITWGDGFYASYAYDTVGGVTSITANGATSGVGVLASYSFDNLGRRTGVSYGNGTARTYAYDPVSRPAGLQLSFPNSANNDLIGAVGGSGTPISYTPSSQIAGITRSNDAYAWTGAYNVSRTYTSNGLNQYTNSGGVTLGYDTRGNLSSSTPASGGATTYSYTKLNELVSVPGTATLYYDPLSRLSEYDTSVSTRFYYSGGTPVAEVANPSGSVTQRYVPGPGTDEVVAWYSGTGNTTAPQFLQTDERGSVIAVTNSGGALVAANSYDEFGIPASTNVGRFGYTGQTWFPEIGLYNYKARWYSPGLGRFMQTDPAGYGDGLNWYNYAHGDAVNGSDPSGLYISYYNFGRTSSCYAGCDLASAQLASALDFTKPSARVTVNDSGSAQTNDGSAGNASSVLGQSDAGMAQGAGNSNGSGSDKIVVTGNYALDVHVSTSTSGISSSPGLGSMLSQDSIDSNAIVVHAITPKSKIYKSNIQPGQYTSCDPHGTGVCVVFNSDGTEDKEATNKQIAHLRETLCALSGVFTGRPATIAGGVTGIGSTVTSRFFLGPISTYLAGLAVWGTFVSYADGCE